MLFSRRRKDIFGASPSIVRFKIGGLYGSTLLGLIGGVGFVVIVAFTALFPQSGYPITPFNVAFEVLMFLLGGVVYYIAKNYRQGHGIDLSLAFKQIPPE
jgi:hypothetical protein